MVPPGVSQTGQPIDEDLACRGCGYNLRGLDTRLACPECGSAIADTLAPAPLAAQSGAYLRRLHRGLVIVQTVAVLGAVIGCIAPPRPPPGAAGGARMTLGPTSPLNLILGALGIWGWWLVTTPRPAPIRTARYWNERRVRAWLLAESGMTLLAVIAASQLGLQALSVPVNGSSSSLTAAAAVSVAVSCIGGCVWGVRLYGGLRSLATLAPHAPAALVEPAAGRLAGWLVALGAVAAATVVGSLVRTDLGVLPMIVLALGSLVWCLSFLGLVHRLRRHVHNAMTRTAYGYGDHE